MSKDRAGIAHKNEFNINDEVSKLRLKNAKLNEVVLCLRHQLQTTEKYVLLQVSKIDELENDISDEVLQLALKKAKLKEDLDNLNVSLQLKEEQMLHQSAKIDDLNSIIQSDVEQISKMALELEELKNFFQDSNIYYLILCFLSCNFVFWFYEIMF